MNGAQAMVHTLSAAGVSVCFANPGTSEMHSVFALDAAADFDAVLCLDEGVVAGAADGYARMAGRPAATLLHLGPGLGNAWANLHNARRARTPMVNIVGDHATYHGRYDAPLESDIGALAGAVSRWVRRPIRAADVGPDTAEAVAAAWAAPGGIATLILPADASWDEGAEPGVPLPRRARAAVPDDVVREAAKVLQSGESTVLLLGGTVLLEAGLRAAGRIAAATGAKVLTQTHVAHLQRGIGRPAFDALGYFAEQADGQLEGVKHIVLVDCPAPVGFFAYPGRPSSFVPPGCAVHALGEFDEDVVGALEALAEQVAPDAAPEVVGAAPFVVGSPDEPLGPRNVGLAVGAALPDQAIVVEESITARLGMAGGTMAAAPHDWLALTGGAIGEGLPLATGAAVACPDRKVISLQADGSAMYTIQALWTQARRRLDVTTVILSNRAYAILQVEMQRIVAEPPGPRAVATLDLGDPELDFAAIANGMGVESVRARTVGELTEALARGVATPGPFLIDAVLS